MHSRLYRRLIVPIAAFGLLAGCVQATRHSNTMVFGTNTSVGLKVGTDTAQVPSILVGYNRQEAVILPLLANVGEAKEKNRLSPCNLGAPVEIVGGEKGAFFPIHPCLFVATHGYDQDSYSVLASFGANFGAEVSADGKPKAQGGLAQYFATGMAAQLLATSGGASVVNTAAMPPSGGGALAAAALFGTEDDRARAVVRVNNYLTFRKSLADAIAADTDAAMLTHLNKLEASVAAPGELSGQCSTKAACASIFADKNNRPFFDEFVTAEMKGETKFNDAIANWGK